MRSAILSAPEAHASGTRFSTDREDAKKRAWISNAAVLMSMYQDMDFDLDKAERMWRCGLARLKFEGSMSDVMHVEDYSIIIYPMP